LTEKYSKEDKELILKKFRDTINELREDFNKWHTHTLVEYVKKCAEIAENAIEAGILTIKKTEISSYLYNEFSKEGIEISDRHIRRVLPEKYKRNYSDSDIMSELKEAEWKTEETKDYRIERNQTNLDEVKIGGIVYRKKKELKKEEIDAAIKKAQEEKPDPKSNPHTNILHNICINNLLCYDIADDLISKFFKAKTISTELTKKYHAKNPEDALIKINEQLETATKAQRTILNDDLEELETSLVRTNAIQSFKDPKEDNRIEIETKATLKHISNLTDDRQKVSEFRKIKAYLLERTTFNIAKVAKLLGISPKHMTNEIIKTHNPSTKPPKENKHMSYCSWFDAIIIKLDGKIHIFNLADYINKQITRRELFVEEGETVAFEPLVLETARAIEK